MRQLTLLQRQRLQLSLFFAVAVGAVVTVAAPAFYPWQVVDEKREQALEQQRRQGIDYHVVPNPRRRGVVPTATTPDQQGGSTEGGARALSSPSSTSPLPLSTFSGALLQENRIPLASPSDIELARRRIDSEHGREESSVEREPGETATLTADHDGKETTSKKRRRRRRKKVNEGWQELTGRTAREEKAKAEAAIAAVATENDGSETSRGQDASGARAKTLGENGGQEIEWKNKTWQHREPVS